MDIHGITAITRDTKATLALEIGWLFAGESLDLLDAAALILVGVAVVRSTPGAVTSD